MLTRKNITKLPSMLSEIRLKKEIKQTVVAKKMAVLQSHVSTMENKAKKKVPQIETLLKYLSAVGCELAIIVN